MAGLHVPLSTLGTGPRGQAPMTRGRDGSLLLPRTALSSATSHQLLLAHQQPVEEPPRSQVRAS